MAETGARPSRIGNSVIGRCCCYRLLRQRCPSFLSVAQRSQIGLDDRDSDPKQNVLFCFRYRIRPIWWSPLPINLRSSSTVTSLLNETAQEMRVLERETVRLLTTLKYSSYFYERCVTFSTGEIVMNVMDDDRQVGIKIVVELQDMLSCGIFLFQFMIYSGSRSQGGLAIPPTTHPLLARCCFISIWLCYPLSLWLSLRLCRWVLMLILVGMGMGIGFWLNFFFCWYQAIDNAGVASVNLSEDKRQMSLPPTWKRQKGTAPTWKR